MTRTVREDGMLVLTRYNEQSIMIGEDIEIRIIAVQGSKVTLGVEAPRDVPVHRREVFDRISHTPHADNIKGKKKNAHKPR
jgi:carbon storage regulator